MPLLCTYDCSFISQAGKVGKLKEKRNESQLNTSLWPLTLVWFCAYVVYHPNTFCMFWIACPYCAQFPFPCAWHTQSGKEHEVQSSICQPENFHLEFGLMAWPFSVKSITPRYALGFSQASFFPKQWPMGHISWRSWVWIPVLPLFPSSFLLAF